MYDEAAKIASEDWEIWHNKGLCFMHMRQYGASIDCFRQANEIAPRRATYRQMGKVFTLQENYRAAVEVYLEALEFSPDRPRCSPPSACSTCAWARATARSITWVTP